MLLTQKGVHVDFSRKKFLIIDDLLEFRASMRQMLEQMGVRNIHAVANAKEAIEHILANHYDVILSDYNLGEGKDGQALLEALKHKNLIKYQTTFVMITAETTLEKVMAALEHAPDGYLAKPFNKGTLYALLKRVVNKKEQFFSIYKAWEDGNHKEAMECCDALMESVYRQKALKLKAEILVSLQEYKQAELLYTETLASKRQPWALLGLAKLYVIRGWFSKAEIVFKKLIETTPMSVEGYDGLSFVLEKQGDLIGALDAIKKAVELSPNTFLRQKRLSLIALRAKDMTDAEHAFRQALRLAKYSIYQDSFYPLYFIHFLLDKANQHEGIKQKRALEEARLLLTRIEKDTSSAAIFGMVACCKGIMLALSAQLKDAWMYWAKAKQAIEDTPALDQELYQPWMDRLKNMKSEELEKETLTLLLQTTGEMVVKVGDLHG